MNLILSELKNISQEIKTALSYQKMFELLGISDLLDKMFIETEDLKLVHLNIFKKAVQDFIKQPLYKDINLDDEKDLIFLRDNAEFKGVLDDIVDKIQRKLSHYKPAILRFFKKFSSKTEVSLKDLKEAVKLDIVSLLFILEDLKKTNQIYDYNGRSVTLL